MFEEVLIDSLHRRFLGLIRAQTDTAVSTPLFTLTGAHETHARKGKGRDGSGQRALRSLANHNTPAQTNQSEPTACF